MRRCAPALLIYALVDARDAAPEGFDARRCRSMIDETLERSCTEGLWR
jgi:hypothetical protein